MFAVVGWLLATVATPARAADPTAEYARQVTMAQTRVAQLEALLVEAELRIEQLEEVIRQQGQNEQNRLENLDQVNAEVSRLRGSIEVLQFESGEMKRVLRDLQLDSERRHLHAEIRLTEVEKFLGVKMPPIPTDEDLGIDPSEAGAEPSVERPTGAGVADPLGEEVRIADGDIPATAQGKLDLAIDHMRAGRQTVARAVLTSALAAHPDTAETDEIRYRLAETYFNDKEYRTAIREFNKVINNHPNSDWKCWSFFRMGEAFDALGKSDGGRAFYKGATERDCRSSEAAKLARDKL